MKIQLPNGSKINLDENISLEEKKEIVDKLTREWCAIILLNWNSNSIKFFLDSLSSYLVWHKEDNDKGKEDKEVMSRKKMEKLTRFKKDSKQINFTDLPKEHKELLLGEGGSE